jgi:hypothetical protein
VTGLQLDLLGGFDARLDGAGVKFRTRKREPARSHAAAASRLRALGMTFWLPDVERRLARG